MRITLNIGAYVFGCCLLICFDTFDSITNSTAQHCSRGIIYYSKCVHISLPVLLVSTVRTSQRSSVKYHYLISTGLQHQCNISLQAFHSNTHHDIVVGWKSCYFYVLSFAYTFTTQLNILWHSRACFCGFPLWFYDHTIEICTFYEQQHQLLWYLQAGTSQTIYGEIMLYCSKATTCVYIFLFFFSFFFKHTPSLSISMSYLHWMMLTAKVAAFIARN